MSKVVLIDPVQDPRWDKFVEDHPYGWITHLSGWKQILEKNFKHLKGYYFALTDEKDRIKAGLPVYQVKSWITGKRLVSIPFATLCDPLVLNKDHMKVLTEEVHKLFKELKCSYIEIRTLKSPGLVSEKNGYRGIGYYKHHYLPLDLDLDQLIKSFHRTCVRKNIRRATKSNLEVRKADKPEDIREFIRLYSMTRKYHGLPNQPCGFIYSILEIFSPSDKADLLITEVNGQDIAGLLIYKFKNQVSAEFLGWDRKFSHMQPSTFMYWSAIKMAHTEGFETFDFGRTAVRNQGLMNFKRHWNPKETNLPIYHYPKSDKYEIKDEDNSGSYKLLRTLLRVLPNRPYKLLGDFCYRHLG